MLKFAIEKNYAILTAYRGAKDFLEIPEKYRGKPVRLIADGVFEGNLHIRHLVVPPTVELIGDRAFKGCVNLLSVKTPGYWENAPDFVSVFAPGLLSIGQRAFQETGLQEILFCARHVVYLSEEAFSGCKNLKSIKLAEPTLLLDMKKNTFSNCPSLKSVPGPKAEPASFSENLAAFFSEDFSSLLDDDEDDTAKKKEATLVRYASFPGEANFQYFEKRKADFRIGLAQVSYGSDLLDVVENRFRMLGPGADFSHCSEIAYYAAREDLDIDIPLIGFIPDDNFNSANNSIGLAVYACIWSLLKGISLNGVLFIGGVDLKGRTYCKYDDPCLSIDGVKVVCGPIGTQERYAGKVNMVIEAEMASDIMKGLETGLMLLEKGLLSA